jgi:hypothetical protein
VITVPNRLSPFLPVVAPDADAEIIAGAIASPVYAIFAL